ncbi:hypothetical protein A8C56_19695 [Niabella ginsenosidivorans]|uniref:Uncharacterized protein n=1 Tax=Niabella ginsenosidivorans TaxID=1176587 RepID=A0A1A9I8C6_9BACT|nr:hypothetical protein A8C56_19695 [Niabella ginsenosidivorans]
MISYANAQIKAAQKRSRSGSIPTGPILLANRSLYPTTCIHNALSPNGCGHNNRLPSGLVPKPGAFLLNKLLQCRIPALL